MCTHWNRLIEATLLSTHKYHFNVKQSITLNYPQHFNICNYGIFSQGLKDELKTAVVNEPSVFEPVKFNCIQNSIFCMHSVWFCLYVFVIHRKRLFTVK